MIASQRQPRANNTYNNEAMKVNYINIGATI